MQKHPSIFLNTVPKSGSVYTKSRLQQGLGLQEISVSLGNFPNDMMIIQGARCFMRGGFIAQQHVDPTPLNLRVMRDFCRRWVIHLRDPRSVTLSYVHHYQKYSLQGGEDWLLTKYSWLSPEDRDFTSRSLEDRIGWCVDHFLPNVVWWTEEWLKVYDSDAYDILLTTYDEMVDEPDAYLRKILDFHEISLWDWDEFAGQDADQKHFRAGRKDEWREAFTPEQIERANALIPDSMFERFGWAR